MPVTTPAALTVATDGVALLQIPAAVVLESAVVEPMQILVVPVMLATTGSALTVTFVETVFTHPLALVTEQEITDVPAVKPVTIPVVPTVATVGDALLQTPDTVVLARAVVEPTQTLVVPVMLATAGSDFMVTSTWEVVEHPLSLTTV